MLQRSKNTLGCPDCGQSWHMMNTVGLKAGDQCPSDSCPSNKETPLGIVYAVCQKFDGNGIYSVGAIAAFQAMAHHWKDHLAEGHDPKIISDDIDGLKGLLDFMGAEVTRRIQAVQRGPAAS